MSKIKTAIEYAKNITTVGAIKESSPKLEKAICSKLDRSKAVNVVEYGMGHGNITKSILAHISDDSRLSSFEINPEFCNHVQGDIQDERLRIINASATDVLEYIKMPVDYIITSLPFSFFSKTVQKRLIHDSYELLKSGGWYSQLLYAVWAGRKLKPVFDTIEMRSFPNFPPEYVFHCLKK